MKPRRKQASRAFALVAAALAVPCAVGCFTLGQGLDPPLQQFYYPTAVITSPGQNALYVVNSDFDIQYTGGTVQAVDLHGLRQCTRRLVENLAAGLSKESACADAGLGLNDNPVIVPGPCAPIDVSGAVACNLTDDEGTPEVEGPVDGPLIRSSRVIGAFSSTAVLRKDPAPSGGPPMRLFVAVRGDPSVTFFEMGDDTDFDPTSPDDLADLSKNPFVLDCKAAVGADQLVGGRCGERARAGVNPFESKRLLTLPVEPVGIAASDDGRAIVTVHQTTATASLLLNTWGESAPSVEFNLTGLGDSPAEIANVPAPAYVAARAAEDPAFDYRPGFLVTYQAVPFVDMLRFYDDATGTGRHFLQHMGGVPVATNANGADSRGLAVSDAERRACEASCDEADLDCLRACVDVPLRVFVANRSPGSLVLGTLRTELTEKDGEVTGATESLSLDDMIPLATGPSRVVVGHVLDADGQPSPRVLAVSFDARYLVVYDPERRQIEATVRTGRGPHAIALDVAPQVVDADGNVTDPGHAFAYVAHFTDSYVGVVDLDTRHTRTYGSMFAAAGRPTPPKESN